jgi:hypothetical protein
MASDYTREFSPELNRAIASANSIEEIRSLMKAELERQGVASRERDGSYVQVEPTHAPPTRSADGEHHRTIYIGNTGYELSGPSEASLDRMEATLRAGR